MWGEKQIDELLEQEIEKNPELAKLFKENPKKKEQYKKKILDSQMGGGGIKVNDKCQCFTCLFAETIEPIGKQPQTAYCKIYGIKDSHGKPKGILDGTVVCEYYEKE